MSKTQRNGNRLMRTLLARLKRRGYHLLFAGAILSLAMLVAWWSVFIRASIERVHDLHYENVLISASILAMTLGQDASQSPQQGVLDSDSRLEVIKCTSQNRLVVPTFPAAGYPQTGSGIGSKCESIAPAYAIPLEPNWPEFSIVPRQQHLDELDREFHRQVVMVIGESSTLLVVLLITIFMLWRMIRLERRSHRELHEFWGRVTHELKTPITGIKAFLQSLQRRTFSQEELQPLLKLALREVERQEMLAENLLLGQRLDQKRFGLNTRAVRVAQSVRDFIDEHRMILPAENLRFELECPEDTMAQADPDALRVILENLTDNALKYGGQKPKLTYEVAASADRVHITLSDEGLGFDPSHADLIFEAYHRLSEEQPRGKHGTGMGLHLSRQLARKMGGGLTAHSKGTGQGASFIISLRRAS